MPGPARITDRRMTEETEDPLLRAFLRGMLAAAEIITELPSQVDMSAVGGVAGLKLAADTLREVAGNPEALLRASEKSGSTSGTVGMT